MPARSWSIALFVSFAMLAGCTCERMPAPVLPVVEIDAEILPPPGADGGFLPAEPAEIAAAYVARICPALAHAECVSAVSCQCPASPPADPACYDAALARCSAVESLIIEDLEGADRVIHEGLLEACRETLDVASDACIAFSPNQLFACRRWIVSPTAVGASCPEGFGGACANGAGYCQLGTCTGVPFHAGEECTWSCGRHLSCIDGVCDAARSTGEACDAHDDCLPPGICLRGQCAVPNLPLAACDERTACPIGFSCEGGTCAPAPSPCADIFECSTDQYCRAFEPMHCVPRPSLGEACLSVTDCQTDAYCDISLARPVCRAKPALGEACAQPGGICANSLACVRTATMQTCVTPVELDGACVSRECASGLRCLEGSCRPLAGVGEACADDCEPGLTCELMGQTCVTPGAIGDVCQSATEIRACAADLSCGAAGRCVSAPLDGEPCLNACRGESTCALTEGGQYRCAPPAPRGERCFFECAESDEYCGLGPGECRGSLCNAVDLSSP